jgi:DNA-binding XRE family transcriptional regulator
MGFKERLKQAREGMAEGTGLTQAAFGALLGVSKQTISHWENGRYEPNIAQLQAICEAVPCSADWLVNGISPESLPPDALAQARFYVTLGPDQRKRWHTLRLLMVNGVSDAHVEKRMPITKQKKETQ